MSEWQSVKLKDICKLVSEKVSIKEATLTNYISTENMLSDFGGVRDAEKLPQTTFVNSFLPEDILFSNIRTYFKKVWIADFTGTVSPDVLVLRANINCDSTFLFYLMCEPSFTEYTVLTSRGAKMPRGDKEAILSYDLSLPPLPEQKAIADVLSALDDKIDLLQRQNETLEKMAETLFRQWFIEEAKEDWEEVALEDVCSRITDGAHYSPASQETGFSMASVKDMYTWGINEETCRKISLEDYEQLVIADCRAIEGDILIAKDGSYLKHVFLLEKDLDVVLLSSIAMLRPNFKYHPMLLTIFLKLQSTHEQMKNIVTGAVIPRIVLKDFRKFPIILPPEEKQKEAIKLIEPIFNKCWVNDKQIQTLQNLRDTLLPKLMSGEVRVKLD
ncbi:restriction endonuclease subunit S [Wohlfahrtiimonas chitiniclastica]|uniref:restriction endonuclease subunit S n=1 Tax=Wohlfahrtiimonas chitiniclastica TaxID=400946 RepID=UPI0021575D95|nr:restriction endonuclease subunit S [Wohlfahrtiimonas chitiniclastica]MDC7253070.1 hypothetical protein [Wohlfahrtiimonas chitiniclastica]